MPISPIDTPPVQRTAGRWVTLRPVRPADYDLIRAAELSDDLGVRWRHAGSTPSPEAFAHSLWAGVLAQFLVVGSADQRMLGLVSAYDPDLRSGTCSVGFARFVAGGEASPGLVEGVLLLADHLFSHWPFRKLYGETTEFNLPMDQALKVSDHCPIWAEFGVYESSPGPLAVRPGTAGL